MKNKIALIATLCFVSLFSCNCNEEKPAPPDNFVRYATDLQIDSKILGMPIKYSVLLPADYVKNPNKRYPVVYLLHGLGDDHKSWNDKWLNIAGYIDIWENTEGLEQMIYIMPQGFRSYYVNRYDGKFNYMDMFIEEFVPKMDTVYRTVADREHRAVAGYSMGGFGAMILASKHPEIFSVSVPLSMSFRTDEQYMTESASGWDNQWGAVFGGKGLNGEARLTDYYKQHCPYYMFTEQTVPQYLSVKYFYDCGDDEEQLLVANNRLHTQLRNIGFAHEFRVRNGAHTSSYWANAMQKALPYISSCFNGVPYSGEENILLPDTLNMSNDNAGVFLPRDYAASGKEYPAVFFFGNLQPLQVAKALQSSREFILFTASDVQDIPEWISECKNIYRISKKHAIICDGNMPLSLMSNTDTLNLFLIDAAIDTLITPNRNNFYYFTLGDDGTNYTSADFLYRYVKKNEVLFEYRVYNGTSSNNSLLYGLLQMKETIINKIK
ncbi:MAG: esterase family protein [Bacteroidales bacterium]|nr:esterase family protein [Bacteroidales bacterium]